MGRAVRVRVPAVGGGPLVRAALGVAAVSAGAVLLGLIWTSHRSAPPPGDPGDVVRVGVVPGQSVPGYLRAAATELAALTAPSAAAGGDTWALVSLDDYIAPGRLPGVLGGAAVAQVYTRVPLPGVHTPVVRIPVYRLPADVLAGMVDAARQRDREQAEYVQLARRLTGDGLTEQRARRAYAAAAAIAGSEAAAYRSGCSCVFAAVIRAAPAVLRGVAGRDGVRAVDPAPEVPWPDRAEFRPPLPEQTGTVPPEPSRPPAVPTGTVSPEPSRPPTGNAGIEGCSGPSLSRAAPPVGAVVPVAPEDPHCLARDRADTVVARNLRAVGPAGGADRATDQAISIDPTDPTASTAPAPEGMPCRTLGTRREHRCGGPGTIPATPGHVSAR